MYSYGRLSIMSKFSSFKEDQLLFENWRGHVNDIPPAPVEEEVEGQNILGHAEKVLGLLGGLTPEEAQEVFQHVLATMKGNTGIQ